MGDIFILVYFAIWPFAIWVAWWLGNGIYTKWHIAYRCGDCGHRNHSLNRFYWRVCPGCGSEKSATIEEKGRVTLFGWQEYRAPGTEGGE